MTTRTSALLHEADCLPNNALAGAVLDVVCESVALPDDPAARASMVCSLLREVFDAVDWVHGPDDDREELASLALVVAAAHDHHSRMLRSAPRHELGP